MALVFAIMHLYHFVFILFLIVYPFLSCFYFIFDCLSIPFSFSLFFLFSSLFFLLLEFLFDMVWIN